MSLSPTSARRKILRPLRRPSPMCVPKIRARVSSTDSAGLTVEVAEAAEEDVEDEEDVLHAAGSKERSRGLICLRTHLFIGMDRHAACTRVSETTRTMIFFFVYTGLRAGLRAERIA